MSEYKDPIEQMVEGVLESKGYVTNYDRKVDDNEKKMYAAIEKMNESQLKNLEKKIKIQLEKKNGNIREETRPY